MLEKLIGRTIVEVRDPEGNDPGHLFVFTDEGQQQ